MAAVALFALRAGAAEPDVWLSSTIQPEISGAFFGLRSVPDRWRELEQRSTDPMEGLERSYHEARMDYRNGKYGRTIDTLQSILHQLDRIPEDARVHEARIRALLLLAHVEVTLGRIAKARIAMERILSLEPRLEPNPEQYSPTYRSEFEAARARVAARANQVIAVSSAPTPPFGHSDVASAPTSPPSLRAVPPDDVSQSKSTPLEPRLAQPRSWSRSAIYATGGAAVLLAGLATYQGIAAHGAYQDARALLRPDGSLAPGADQGRFDAMMERGDSAARWAYLAAGGALLMAAATGVLWWLSGEPSSAAPLIRF